MAAPFYSQADQDIYASGNRFIPQEQYRLNYAPPSIMGQNTNAGIVNTQAAGSYMGYPSYEAWLLAQGGGGNGGGNDPIDNINRGGINQNLGPTNITDYEAEAAGKGSTWRGSLARVQDLYSKLPTPGNILKWGIDKYQSSKAEKEEEEARLTTATRRRAIDKLQAKYQKDPDFIPPHPGGGGDVIQTPPTNGTTGGYEPANVGQQTTGRADSSWEHDPFAQGGRIGYRNGEFVDEDVNIEGPGFDVNENIEMAEGEITDEQKAMVLDMLERGMDLPTIISITGVAEADILSLMGGETSMAEDQGIASLV